MLQGESRHLAEHRVLGRSRRVKVVKEFVVHHVDEKLRSSAIWAPEKKDKEGDCQCQQNINETEESIFFSPSVCHGEGAWLVGDLCRELVGDAPAGADDGLIRLKVGVRGGAGGAAGTRIHGCRVFRLWASELSHETGTSIINNYFDVNILTIFLSSPSQKHTTSESKGVNGI